MANLSMVSPVKDVIQTTNEAHISNLPAHLLYIFFRVGKT